MKKAKKVITLLICVIMFSLSSTMSGAAPMKNSDTKVPAANTAYVSASRFLNMLNRNANYNSDFESLDIMLNNAVTAQLNLRDKENEDFIRADFVTGFIKDMYGIDIDDVSCFNTEYPQLDGFVYIIPRGYTTYSHEFVSAKENEDGSSTVYTIVTVTTHDGTTETYECVSLFVPNETSAFGYSLITSDLILPSQSI